MINRKNLVYITLIRKILMEIESINDRTISNYADDDPLDVVGATESITVNLDVAFELLNNLGQNINDLIETIEKNKTEKENQNE